MAYLFGKEGFESGDKGAFDSDGDWGGGTTSFDSGSKITGTYTEKCSMTGEGGSLLIEDLGSDYETLFVQFKLHLPSGWSFDAGTYTGLLAFLDSGDSELIAFSMEDWNGAFEMTSWSAETSDWRDVGAGFSAGNTYKVEVKLVKKASGGEIKVWIDNDTEGSPDYNFSGDVGDTDIRNVYVGCTYADNSHDPVYFDDVIISETFIGTPASGTNVQFNLADSWKSIAGLKLQIGDSWKDVAGMKINIGDSWKTIF